MRPAHEVHHRLRWGGDVALDQVEIVVHDRRRGPVAMPLLAFRPGGRIPWSRVVAYRIGGKVVWDRQAKIDRVFATPLRSAAVPCGFTWDGTAWVRTDGVPRGVPDRLRALTWNVLFDRYDADRVRTAERHPRLLGEIRDADVDLVGLQEVERPLLERVLAEPWVRRSYAASDGPDGATVAPYGQLLLSRWPISEVRTVALDGHKRFLVATVLVRGAPIHVVVVHLSSDHRQGAEKRRASELAALASVLPPSGPAVVLGDFNADGPLPLPLDDAWTLLHPEDPGTTFDPTTNALARTISSSGLPRRLDRVLVRGIGVRSIALVGDDTAELPVSDHRGVLAELLPSAATPGASTADPLTACVIALPPSVAEGVEPIRRRADPNRWRWPGHLTVLHGFVPEAELGRIPVEVPRFELRLVGTTLFHQADRTLVVAVPDVEGAAAIAAIRARMLELAPGCAPERHSEPHLTVARLAERADADRVRAELEARLPLAWTVDRVELWARTPDGPMIPRGRPPELLGDVLRRVGAVEDPGRARIRDRILARIPAEVVGSDGLGAALPEGDLDLVVPDPSVLRGRAVPGGAVRWVEDGLAVDVTAGLDRPERERDAILAAVASRPTAFRTVLRACKAWAEARQVGDPAWGFPGGLGWAIAVAATVGDAVGDPVEDGAPETWLARVFERLLDPAPIGLGDLPLAEEGLLPRIWTVDRRPVVRQALPETAAVLREELERAWVLAQDRDWAALLRPAFAPVDAVHLDLRGGAPVLGWLRGRARGLLEALTVGGAVRPWPRPTERRGGVVRVSVSAEGPTSRALDELAERFRTWRERPDDAERVVQR